MSCFDRESEEPLGLLGASESNELEMEHNGIVQLADIQETFLIHEPLN